jgi:hypothetical protein
LREEGTTDLLLLMGDPALGPRRIEVLWNDGGGNFSVDDRTIVAVARQRDVLAFSVMPGASARIAFVTDSALHVAKLSTASKEFEDVAQVKPFHDARGVVVLDPNVDGVDDVVVADADGLWLVKAQLK